MKKEIRTTLKKMSSKQLVCIYLSLTQGNKLRFRIHLLLQGRGQTISGIRKYHNLY